jgi:2-polyprenyl-6-methoxyphenol hydroxylase-like FAD-dependent oxidoreductase
LAVQARTLEFYRQLGIDQELVAGGVKIANLNFWVRGAIAARVPLQQIGEGLSPYPFALVFPQDAHEKLLIKHLAALGVKVERQTELLRFEQNETAVQATLKLPNGSEQVCGTTYLAGCDGASSTVRETLGIGFPGGTYSGLFYVADVEATGSATDDQLHADLEDADFALVFPLQGKGRIRLVGSLREGTTREEKPTFDDVKDKAVQHLKLHVTKVNWFSTYRVHHRVAQRFREGRAFLLGDAAHVHSPVGGQGMNTGIGDAVNLAWKLAAVLKGNAAEEILDTYEPERIGFAQRLVATTDRAFTLVTKQSAVAQFVRTRVVPRVVPLLFRVPPLRRFMFKTLSQIAVNYRASALSCGKAGGVTGGDRLPWIELGDGKDNFAPLASIRWQVHVYGKPRAKLDETCAELHLSLHLFPWRQQMSRAGLCQGALYLVRPDGYVALADRDSSPERLQNYFRHEIYRAKSAPREEDKA